MLLVYQRISESSITDTRNQSWNKADNLAKESWICVLNNADSIAGLSAVCSVIASFHPASCVVIFVHLHCPVLSSVTFVSQYALWDRFCAYSWTQMSLARLGRYVLSMPNIERYQRASAISASIFGPYATSSTKNEGGICQNCPTSRGTNVRAPSALASFPPVSLCRHSVAWLAVWVKIPSESARSERPFHPAVSGSQPMHLYLVLS